MDRNSLCQDGQIVSHPLRPGRSWSRCAARIWSRAGRGLGGSPTCQCLGSQDPKRGQATGQSLALAWTFQANDVYGGGASDQKRTRGNGQSMRVCMPSSGWAVCILWARAPHVMWARPPTNHMVGLLVVVGFCASFGWAVRRRWRLYTIFGPGGSSSFEFVYHRLASWFVCVHLLV